MAEIEEEYLQAVGELMEMQVNPRLRRKKVGQIREMLARDKNPIIVVELLLGNFTLIIMQWLSFYDDGDLKEVFSLLKRFLFLKPDYKPALEMKKRLLKFSELH